MNEGAVILDRNGIILYSNQCFAHLLKLPLEKVIGSSFFNFIPNGFQTYFKELFGQGWEGKSKGEIPLQHRTGTLAPFSLSMNTLPLGESTGLGVIVTDLSAQQEIRDIKDLADRQNTLIEHQNQEIRRQDNARKEAQQMGIILESLPQIAWTTNAAGKSTYFNRQWYAYSGTAPAHDFSLDQFMHPDDAASAMEQWQYSLTTGQPFETEYRLLRASDGAYRWMLGRALALRNEGRNYPMGRYLYRYPRSAGVAGRTAAGEAASAPEIKSLAKPM